MTTFEPNIPGVYDMPASDYFRAPGVSNSMLSHMDPPARLPAYLEAPRKTSPFMRMGTLIHSRILEPEKPLQGYAWKPDGLSLATKEGKAWKAEQVAKGLEILDRDDAETLAGCVNAVRSDPTCKSIFAKGRAELSVFSEMCGVFTKSRMDWLPDASTAIVDVKKVGEGDASRDEFAKILVNRRYHVQAAFYLDNWNSLMGNTDWREHFVFVVVEDVAPYLVNVFTIEPRTIELGRNTYRRELEIYASCKASGNWPRYLPGIKKLNAPEWALRKDS